MHACIIIRITNFNYSMKITQGARNELPVSYLPQMVTQSLSQVSRQRNNVVQRAINTG